MLSKLIFASLCDTPIARVTGSVSSKDIGRRIPLKLQCSYQGQQGNVSQVCARKQKNPFLRGTKSDTCGRKCISSSSESCKWNVR